MTLFTAAPLSLSDSVYIPPEAELEKIVRACTQRAQSVWLVQGGYRMGKTSFFNAAAERLRPRGVIPCVVDFGGLTTADFEGVLVSLAGDVAAETHIPNSGFAMSFAIHLLHYLNKVMEELPNQSLPYQPHALALLLENLPALKHEVLADCVNLLVTLINNRLRLRKLHDVTVVLTGGLYLENSKDIGLSPLHDRLELNQSTTLNLPSLDRTQTQDLVRRGLQDEPLTAGQMALLGNLIYEHTEGHPALVHRMGTMLWSAVAAGQAPTAALAADVAETLAQELGRGPGTFRSHLAQADQEWHIVNYARALPAAGCAYSRLNPVIRILDSLGLVKQLADRKEWCVVHNAIFRRALEVFPAA